MMAGVALLAAACGVAASRFATKIPADKNATKVVMANFDEFDMGLFAQMTI